MHVLGWLLLRLRLRYSYALTILQPFGGPGNLSQYLPSSPFRAILYCFKNFWRSLELVSRLSPPTLTSLLTLALTHLFTYFYSSPLFWFRWGPPRQICWPLIRYCRSAPRTRTPSSQRSWIRKWAAGRLEGHPLGTGQDRSWRGCWQSWYQSRRHRCLSVFGGVRRPPGIADKILSLETSKAPPTVLWVGQLICHIRSAGTCRRRLEGIFPASWRVHAEIKWTAHVLARRGPLRPSIPPKN